MTRSRQLPAQPLLCRIGVVAVVPEQQFLITRCRERQILQHQAVVGAHQAGGDDSEQVALPQQLRDEGEMLQRHRDVAVVAQLAQGVVNRAGEAAAVKRAEGKALAAEGVQIPRRLQRRMSGAHRADKALLVQQAVAPPRAASAP